MNTYFLMASTAAALETALSNEGFFFYPDGASEPEFSGNFGEYFVDMIGQIFKSVGQIAIEVDDGEGGTRTELIEDMQPVPGWHCNIYSKLALPANLQDFVVSPTPATPYRKLAGT